MSLIDALKNIGFTQQEAIIYTILCKQGEMSGYEAAKLTGISRSNAYAALSSLVEKGGAYVIEQTTRKYVATPKNELLMNVQRAFRENIKYLEEHLSFEPVSKEPYITITGEKNIIDKIKNMITLAEKRMYISAALNDLQLFSNDIKQANNRGLKIVLITNSELSKDLFFDDITLYQSDTPKDSFKIIVDTNEVLSGKLNPDNQALYSKNNTLVKLVREAFINEIELIKIRDNY